MGLDEWEANPMVGLDEWEANPMVSRHDVRDTYDQIASHFAKTRPHPWTEVEAFLRDQRGHIGLDLGVGNGRHAEVLSGYCDTVLGVDTSLVALGEARRRAHDHEFGLRPVVGDAATLPLRDGCVDVAVYIATLHHLPERELRVASLEELGRVLARSGRAIVSVWSVAHDRFDAAAGFDTTVDWTLPNGVVVQRYYHIYDDVEFGRDVDASGLYRHETFESRGNCFAIVGPEQ